MVQYTDSQEILAEHNRISNFRDNESVVRDRIARNVRLLEDRMAHFGRQDAIASNQAYHLARELEYTYSTVVRQQYAPNSALSLFATDSSVPAGARTHKVHRLNHSGEARYYSHAGDDRGQAGVDRLSKEFPILPIVTSFNLDFFDEMTNAYAGFNHRAELEFASRLVMDQFMNDKVWNGSDEHNMRGVLNYEWLPRLGSALTWADSGTTAEAQYTELIKLGNTQFVESKTRFSPTRLITSVRLKNYLMSKHMAIGNRNESILDSFLSKQDHITQVVGVPELRGVGSATTDVMLFDRPEAMTIRNVIPQGFTMLPMARDSAFRMHVPIYMLHGGVVMMDVLNTLRVDCTVGDEI